MPSWRTLLTLWVLSEQARWVTPRDADRRFDALSAPVFQGGKIGLSTVSSCRLRAAVVGSFLLAYGEPTPEGASGTTVNGP